MFLECRQAKDRGREDVTVFWRYITVGIKKDYALSRFTYAHGFYWFIYLFSQMCSSLIDV